MATQRFVMVAEAQFLRSLKQSGFREEALASGVAMCLPVNEVQKIGLPFGLCSYHLYTS